MGNTGKNPFDEAFAAMADPERRALLLALQEHNPQSIPGTPVEESSGESGNDRRIQMVHVHLPKLVDAGFVDWDRETQELSKGPNFATVRPLLELVDEECTDLPGNVDLGECPG